MAFLQVDIDEMRAELDRLKNAIEIFRPFVESGFESEIELVEAMNSDFTTVLKDILSNLSDKKAKEMLEKLEMFHGASVFVVDGLEIETDQAMAQEIGGNIDG